VSAESDRLALEALRLFVRQVVRDELAAAPAAPAAVEGFIGTVEAGRRAGVRADTILEWIERGTLPATRPARTKQWRIRPSDLEAMLSERGGGPPVSIAAKRVERAARIAAAAAARSDDGRGKGR
jgi:excisionase family DNA binding protein